MASRVFAVGRLSVLLAAEGSRTCERKGIEWESSHRELRAARSSPSAWANKIGGGRRGTRHRARSIEQVNVREASQSEQAQTSGTECSERAARESSPGQYGTLT